MVLLLCSTVVLFVRLKNTSEESSTVVLYKCSIMITVIQLYNTAVTSNIALLPNSRIAYRAI